MNSIQAEITGTDADAILASPARMAALGLRPPPGPAAIHVEITGADADAILAGPARMAALGLRQR